MKSLKNLLNILLVSCTIVACTSPTTGKVSVVTTAEKAQPYLRPASAATGIAMLAVTKDGESKLARAKWLFAVATAIRSISSNQPPTAEEFKLAITAITPVEQDDWTQVAVALSSLYSSFKAQFGNNTATVLQAVEQLALGLEDAARPYVRVVN